MRADEPIAIGVEGVTYPGTLMRCEILRRSSHHLGSYYRNEDPVVASLQSLLTLWLLVELSI
jgi:hypothetical protein